MFDADNACSSSSASTFVPPTRSLAFFFSTSHAARCVTCHGVGSIGARHAGRRVLHPGHQSTRRRWSVMRPSFAASSNWTATVPRVQPCGADSRGRRVGVIWKVGYSP